MHQKVFESIVRSPFFREYADKFHTATGASLKFIPSAQTSPREEHGSPDCALCNLMVRVRDGCGACHHDHERKNRNRSAEQREPFQVRCVSGLCVVAIPVWVDGHRVGTFFTGRVLLKKPTRRGFRRALRGLRLSANAGGRRLREKLKRAYFAAPVMSKAEFQAIGHLATAFAQHLSDFAHRRVLVSKRGEPSAIRKAKEFIEANTHRRLKLAEVGQHIGLSTGHLCRVFSQTTGMTVIDFVNRVRVERAKDLLLTRCVRAKEAAAQAGFFSIAQFNRAFHAIVGQSPTEFRRSRCQSRGSDSGIRRQAATSQSAHRM